MKKQRIVVLLLSVLMVFTLFTGCSPRAPSSSSNKATTVTLLVPPWGVIKDQSKINAFTQSSGIKIQFNAVGWDVLENKITIAAAAGIAAADINEVDWSWVGAFEKIGCMEPLTVSSADKADFSVLSSFAINGKILGLPYSNDYRMIIYNKKEFEKAGVTAAPVTWDDLIADSKKIKEKGVIQYPFNVSMSVSEGTTTDFMLITLSRTGAIFNSDNTINRANILSTLNLYNEMLKVDKIMDPSDVSTNFSEFDEFYLRGKNPIDFNGPSMYSTANDPKQSSIVNQSMFMLMPGNSGKRSITFGLPEAVGVSKYSKNKDAALKVLEWYTSPDMQKSIYTTNGVFPTRISVLANIYGSNINPAQQVILDQAKYIISPFPNGIPTWFPQFDTALQNAICEMGQGIITPDQAADVITSTVNNLIKSIKSSQ